MRRFLIISIVFIAFTACERGKTELARAKKPISPVSESEAQPDLFAPPRVIEVMQTVIDGEKTYKANCAACHQVTGQGLPGAFPPLVGSEWVTTDNHQILASIMLYGLQGEIVVKGQTWNNVMAGLGGVMTDDELAATANYVRSAWGNSASEELTAQVFADMRAKWGARAMLSVSELENAFGNP